MGKAQNTFEKYFVAVVFADGRDLVTTTVSGKNLTAKEAALKGAAKASGWDSISDSGFTIEKDHTYKKHAGWERFLAETRYGEPFEVAVAHASTKLA